MASHITVLVVDGGRDPLHFGDAPGANLVQHLTRHGAQVELVEVESHGAPVAEVILGQCEQQGADLLEYGRASCRERVCQYGSISVVAVALTKKKRIRNRGD